ncbi:MAG: type IV pilus twitching motility protein PilT [Eubacteriales bacterium]|nr:type IV pilus twitching motility protein PilT [Lachnospiraceae bacterium]MDO5127749.1 type IV pilus twitching motility protein PilT [Eubacteriales bacterium]
MDFLSLIQRAKREGCSDVHITVGTHIVFRKFGELEMIEPKPTIDEAEELIWGPLTDEQYEYIKSGKDLDFAMMLPDHTRLRANIYHQRNNLAASYRLLQDEIPGFDELLVPPAVRKLVNEPRGLVLITGPTGSGKTTTLASMIDCINKNQRKHIITIEDPIEYLYPYSKCMIHQREVGKDVDNFSDALRSSLREDPDVILVGEMRDYETIKAAITAAETGHLVLSTLHTSSAAQTIERIIDAYPPHGQAQARTQLANVLRGVATQVLIPRSDRQGMIMATEVLINNEAIANQIRDNKTHQIQSSIQGGASLGMHTMNADLKRLVFEGKISYENALTFSPNPKEFDSLR